MKIQKEVRTVVEMKQIHHFAVKWCDKFRDLNINDTELIGHWMADECKALGFKLDRGQAFSEKYINVTNNSENLDKIIDEVTDIHFLGSAIYSQLHYFSYCPTRVQKF